MMRFCLLACTLALALPAWAAPPDQKTAAGSQQQARQQNTPYSTNDTQGLRQDSGVRPSFARDPNMAMLKPGPNRIICPLEMHNVVSIDGEETANWMVGGYRQTSPLKGARVFAGPLSEMTVERYNEITAIPVMNREQGEFQQVWTFNEKQFQAGIVLVCDYAGNTQFLMRAIPPTIRQCKESDTIDKNDNAPTVVLCE